MLSGLLYAYDTHKLTQVHTNIYVLKKPYILKMIKRTVWIMT